MRIQEEVTMNKLPVFFLATSITLCSVAACGERVLTEPSAVSQTPAATATERLSGPLLQVKSSTGVPISLLVEGYASAINSRGQVAGDSYGEAVLWTRGVPRTLEGDNAQALNDRGQVAVRVRGEGAVGSALYIWHRGRRTELAYPAGYRDCMVSDLNNWGRSVGRCYSSTRIGYAAVIWGRKGNPFELPEPSNATWSKAAGINDRGDVVGYAYVSGSHGSGIRWRRGGMFVLQTKSGTGLSRANAINNRGRIVGACLGQSQLACEWYNGNVSVLEPLPGDDQSNARAVNARGTVVGSSSGPGGQSAVLWKDGIPVDLGSPPGAGNSTWAVAINNRGQVAGTSIVGNNALPYVVVWETSRPVPRTVR